MMKDFLNQKFFQQIAQAPVSQISSFIREQTSVYIIAIIEILIKKNMVRLILKSFGRSTVKTQNGVMKIAGFTLFLLLKI